MTLVLLFQMDKAIIPVSVRKVHLELPTFLPLQKRVESEVLEVIPEYHS